MADNQLSPPGARSAGVAIAAVALVALLVLGAILFESLRSPGGDERADLPETPPGGSGSPLGEGGPARGDGGSPNTADPSSTPVGAGVEIKSLDAWRELLQSDPAAAASSLGKMEAGEERDDRLAELMAHWTSIAPEQAGAWLLAQANGEFRDEAAADFSRSWAGRDPGAAAGWIDRNIDAAAAEQAIGGLVGNWVKQDPQAAQEWVDSIDHAPAAKTAAAALAYSWVQADPQAAAAWVAALDDQGMKTAAAINLINAWSSSDPSRAADWLKVNLTEPQQRDAAAVPLLMAWADIDPLAASKWVAGLPGGELQETSKAIFAESLALEAPEDAIVWARSIEDQESRIDSILNIYEEWLESDSAALLSHLRGNVAANADPELREEIYDMLYEYDPQFRDQLLKLYEESEQ